MHARRRRTRRSSLSPPLSPLALLFGPSRLCTGSPNLPLSDPLSSSPLHRLSAAREALWRFSLPPPSLHSLSLSTPPKPHSPLSSLHTPSPATSTGRGFGTSAILPPPIKSLPLPPPPPPTPQTLPPVMPVTHTGKQGGCKSTGENKQEENLPEPFSLSLSLSLSLSVCLSLSPLTGGMGIEKPFEGLPCCTEGSACCTEGLPCSTLTPAARPTPSLAF
jgi:hypothetical protein